jgi:hypothetical protein
MVTTLTPSQVGSNTLMFLADSVADVRAIDIGPSASGLSSLLQCFLSGINAPADGGAGQFIYDPLSTAVDDGVSVITPTVTLSPTMGRWLRTPISGNTTVYVGRFGAAQPVSITTSLSSVYKLYIATAASITLTLPVGPSIGDSYVIKNQSNGVVTISGGGTNIWTNAAVATVHLIPGQAGEFVYDGTYWSII